MNNIDGVIRFTPGELSTIHAALRSAAQQYEHDAKNNADTERIAAQFRRQANAATVLAESLEKEGIA